jgi:hypothetical protein
MEDLGVKINVRGLMGIRAYAGISKHGKTFLKNRTATIFKA